MPDRITFTKSAVERIPAPSQGRVQVFDSKVRGLCLRITAAGSRSFYVVKKVNRRPKRYFICKWPDLTVEQIRKSAEAINAAVAKGDDPGADRKAARECRTLGEAWAYYLEHHAKPHKKSWKFDEWQWNKYLKARWAGRSLADIETADVDGLHKRIGRDTGIVPANRLRSLLHAIFETARKFLRFTGQNPVKGVKRFVEQNRERYLGADELPRLLDALDAEPNAMLADFFRLAIFTGARRGNLQTARWDEIDLATGVWTIPASKAKAKRTIPVPLGPEAMEVLQRRREATKASPWVFPSHGASGHLTEPKAAWKRICKAAGLQSVRLHDLRHTVASWMVARGVSLYVVGKALGHANTRTTERYAHLELGAIRAALSGATQGMAATQPKEGASNG